MMASSPDSRRVAAVCSQSPPLPLHVCRVALRPAEGEGGAEQPQQPAGRDCKWTARSDSDDDDDAVPRTALVRQQIATTTHAHESGDQESHVHKSNDQESQVHESGDQESHVHESVQQNSNPTPEKPDYLNLQAWCAARGITGHEKQRLKKRQNKYRKRRLQRDQEPHVYKSSDQESQVHESGDQESQVHESGNQESHVYKSSDQESQVHESGDQESHVRESIQENSNPTPEKPDYLNLQAWCAARGITGHEKQRLKKRQNKYRKRRLQRNQEPHVYKSSDQESQVHESGGQESQVHESGDQESHVHKSGDQESQVREFGDQESHVHESVQENSNPTPEKPDYLNLQAWCAARGITGHEKQRLKKRQNKYRKRRLQRNQESQVHESGDQESHVHKSSDQESQVHESGDQESQVHESVQENSNPTPEKPGIPGHENRRLRKRPNKCRKRRLGCDTRSLISTSLFKRTPTPYKKSQTISIWWRDALLEWVGIINL